MAINVNDIKFLVETYSNSFQSGKLSPSQFNAIIKAVNYDFLKWRVGLPESYQAGNPTPPIAYDITQKITDDVKQFIVISEIPINADGYFTLPSDYFAFSSWRYKWVANSDSCKGEPDFKITTIDILSDAELSDVLDNTIVFPDFLYPKAAYYSYGLKVYPEGINKVICTYLRIPVTPVWGFTNNDDEPVYAPSASTNFEYPESCFNDIAMMILKYMGINIREEQLIAFAQQREVAGK